MLEESESLAAAHELMRAHKLRHLPIVDDDAVVGIVSERDPYSMETLDGVAQKKVRVAEVMTSVERRRFLDCSPGSTSHAFARGKHRRERFRANAIHRATGARNALDAPRASHERPPTTSLRPPSASVASLRASLVEPSKSTAPSSKGASVASGIPSSSAAGWLALSLPIGSGIGGGGGG